MTGAKNHPGIQHDMSHRCGAGWQPARDPEGAPAYRRRSTANAAIGPIDNRPQINNLPHKASAHPRARSVFHEIPRAERPSQQTTKGDGLSHLPPVAFPPGGLDVRGADLAGIEVDRAGEAVAAFPPVPAAEDVDHADDPVVAA